MKKPKKINVVLERLDDGEDDKCDLCFPDIGRYTFDFCWPEFSKICFPFAKGLHKGQSRKLVLTHLKHGIKIERAEK